MNLIKFLILSFFIVTVTAQVTIPILPDGTKNYKVTGGNGVNIFVEEKGDSTKPTLLLVSSIMSSRLGWEVQFNDPSLNANFHLVRYDYRGTGRSDKPNDLTAYSTDLHVLDLNAVIDSVKTDKIVLVGSSFGALVSIGSMKTKKVDGFISVSGIFNGNIPFFTNATPPSDVYQTAIDTYVAGFPFITAKPLSDQFNFFLFGDLSTLSPAYRHNTSPIPDYTDIFRSLNIPTLFLIGDQDSIIPANYSAKFVSLAKNGQKITYTGVGHSPQFEVTQTFNNDVSNFASKV